MMDPVSIIFLSFIGIIVLSLILKKLILWLQAWAGKGKFVKSFIKVVCILIKFMLLPSLPEHF